MHTGQTTNDHHTHLSVCLSILLPEYQVSKCTLCMLPSARLEKTSRGASLTLSMAQRKPPRTQGQPRSEQEAAAHSP